MTTNSRGSQVRSKSTMKKTSGKSFGNQTQKGKNKENLTVNLKQTKKKNQSLHGGLRSSTKKPLVSGNNVNKELEFLKSKMKEHFKFFSQYSPELMKKRVSYSPAKNKKRGGGGGGTFVSGESRGRKEWND